MARTVFENLDAVVAAVGTHLGHSDWLAITDERIARFAAATAVDGDGDRGAHGGGTVAPCELTLALTNFFLPQIVEVRGISAGVNYGAERVRYPAPARSGASIRAGAELLAADEVPGGIQTTMRITVEVAGSDEPACVVDSLSRYLA